MIFSFAAGPTLRLTSEIIMKKLGNTAFDGSVGFVD